MCHVPVLGMLTKCHIQVCSTAISCIRRSHNQTLAQRPAVLTEAFMVVLSPSRIGPHIMPFLLHSICFTVRYFPVMISFSGFELLSSAMWCNKIQWKLTGILEENTASIFRVTEYTKQATCKKQAAGCLIFNPEHGGSIFLQNVSELQRYCTWSLHKRQCSLYYNVTL